MCEREFTRGRGEFGCTLKVNVHSIIGENGEVRASTSRDLEGSRVSQFSILEQ